MKLAMIIKVSIIVILISFSLSMRDIKNRKDNSQCLVFNGFSSVPLHEFDSLINSTYKTLTCLHSKFFIEKIFTDLKLFHSFSDDLVKFCCKEIDTFENTVETKFKKSLSSIKNQLKKLKFSNEYVESKGLQLVFFLANNNYFDEDCKDKEPDEFMEIDLGPNESDKKLEPVKDKKPGLLKQAWEGSKKLVNKLAQKAKNFFKKLFKCSPLEAIEEDTKRKK